MAKRAFVKNPNKVMGKSGSLRKSIGKNPKAKLGYAAAKKIAAGSGPNAKKAAAELTLNRAWGKK